MLRAKPLPEERGDRFLSTSIFRQRRDVDGDGDHHRPEKC
jgi:hypothetical protein